MIKKNTEINIHVGLDENHVPEKISWSAQDGGVKDASCKALMLSLWNDLRMESERIDLWVKEMPLDDMKKFFHQTFLSMADTYYRATSDEKLQKEIVEFARAFAKKSGLLRPANSDS